MAFIAINFDHRTRAPVVTRVRGVFLSAVGSNRRDEYQSRKLIPFIPACRMDVATSNVQRSLILSGTKILDNVAVTFFDRLERVSRTVILLDDEPLAAAPFGGGDDTRHIQVA